MIFHALHCIRPVDKSSPTKFDDLLIRHPFLPYYDRSVFVEFELWKQFFQAKTALWVDWFSEGFRFRGYLRRRFDLSLGKERMSWRKEASKQWLPGCFKVLLVVFSPKFLLFQKYLPCFLLHGGGQQMMANSSEGFLRWFSERRSPGTIGSNLGSLVVWDARPQPIFLSCKRCHVLICCVLTNVY